MLIPGLEIPHLCVQCYDYPCMESCPVDAISVNPDTEAVIVDKDKCTACGLCTDACPGKIPYIHPTENYSVICDLCGGTPKCVEACGEGEWNCLQIIEKDSKETLKLYARTPEERTEDLAYKIYGKRKGEEI